MHVYTRTYSLSLSLHIQFKCHSHSHSHSQQTRSKYKHKHKHMHRHMHRHGDRDRDKDKDRDRDRDRDRNRDRQQTRCWHVIVELYVKSYTCSNAYAQGTQVILYFTKTPMWTGTNITDAGVARAAHENVQPKEQRRQKESHACEKQEYANYDNGARNIPKLFEEENAQESCPLAHLNEMQCQWNQRDIVASLTITGHCTVDNKKATP